MFASLPQEQDEMVLCNQLQLGQLIFIEKLEAAHPVPVLKGIRPLPCRFPCAGNPEDLFAIDKLVDSRGASDLVMEKSRKVEKKPWGRYRSLIASKSRQSEKKRASCSSGSGDVVEREMCVVTKGFRELSSSFVEKDSDSDCTSTLSSSSSVLAAKQRNWNWAEVADTPFVKQEMKPTAHRSRSACASSVRSATCYGSVDNSSRKTRNSDDHLTKKLIETSSRISVSAKNYEQSLDSPVTFNLADDNNWSERKIPWKSLSPTLVKLGKEVLRQRDVAVLAAVEALQEASAAERLLKCLSTYSELQSSKREEHQLSSVNKFLDLQDDLARTGLIVQSLTNISLLKANDTIPSSPSSIREALVLAFDRKKNATSWIKAAWAVDLTPYFAPGRESSVEATNPSHKPSKTNGGGKPKGNCIVKTKHKNEARYGFAIEKENSSQDWVKGSALSAAADLEKSLHDECRRWFLASFERYLDEVLMSKSTSMKSDGHVAEMTCQIKKIGDWLDNKDDPDQLEAYGRIKNKIYGMLLKHVERTAMFLEHMNAVIGDRQLRAI